MFIDEIQFFAQAGRGGDGVVRWRREKFIDKGGPNGGDGGRGGSVFAIAVQDIHLLSKYKHKKSFKADRGDDGAGGSRHGKDGKDLIIELPVGSVITNAESGASVSLDTVGQKELLLKGGFGGFGNEQFKTSINTTPTKATKGKLGEDGHFKIELQLFAEIGLIGLPNAGKSSLLNAVTNAQAKIGSYQFTTLDPNLGDFYGHIIADIPGLIEGASEGKGLGIKFLRHIKRTKTLMHLVSLENEKPLDVYKKIRKELGAYDKSLLEKEEIIVLTKTDVVEDPKIIEKRKKEFEKLGNPILTLSLYDDASVKAFMKELAKLLK
ncbi:MAG: GTPase ObgE [Candidatus Pacebacteria bacterium]|jgi:GTP-binding protein|nr:GTPase ObgE [Candidatus Paceibacterota bacterium]